MNLNEIQARCEWAHPQSNYAKDVTALIAALRRALSPHCTDSEELDRLVGSYIREAECN